MNNEENVLKVGANPTATTIFPSEKGKPGPHDTKTTQPPTDSDDGAMRSPWRSHLSAAALWTPGANPRKSLPSAKTRKLNRLCDENE